MRKYLVISILIFLSGIVAAQNAKQFVKDGILDMENGLFPQAIDDFKQAIQLDARYAEVYVLRAGCFLNIYDTLSAAKDYEIAAQLELDPVLNYYKAAGYYLKLKNYIKAKEIAHESLAINEKDNPAWIILLKASIEQNEWSRGLDYAEKAFELNEDGLSFFYSGLVFYYNNKIAEARNAFEKSIIKNQNLLDAYLYLAQMQLKSDEIQYAIDNCNYVLLKDNYNYQASYLRSKAYFQLREPEKCINDITKAISLQPETNYFLTRGLYQYEFGNYQEAIEDFAVVIARKESLDTAYTYRALAFEKTGREKLAVNDYRYLTSHPQILNNDTARIAQIKEKIYQLNFEENKPGIHIQQPLLTDKNEIPVEAGTKSFMLSGIIQDENIISALAINNKNISFDSDSIGHASFVSDYVIENSPFVTISATDLYGNTTSITHAIVEIETEAPKVSIISPQTDAENYIFIDNDDKYLYIEGYINDNSLIKQIHVDNTTASFKLSEVNPRFTATVDVQNKNSINIQAVDEYDNTGNVKYKIIRGRKKTDEIDPMGKTWVVIIENSLYENYSNLVSPAQDAENLKSALANYQVNHIIHKQNMTKRELERFFAIDLRNLVKSNKVESLMIYYTGHGDYQNETGYWIPVDADVDDEFANYNVNALKASLYSYTTVKHLLVMIDACLAGPAFQVAMKGPIQQYSCSDTMLVNQKSYQAFTSANTGYALDNSQFTSYLINNLNTNTSSCLSIDAIATQVIAKMKTTAIQEPVFGRIVGLRDEEGTFFFFRK